MSARQENFPIYKHGRIPSRDDLCGQITKLSKSPKDISWEELNANFKLYQTDCTFLNTWGYNKNSNSTQAITLENCKYKRIYTGYTTPDYQKIYLFFKIKQLEAGTKPTLFEGWDFAACNTEKSFQEACRKNKITLLADDKFYEQLATYAIEESWDYRHHTSAKNKPLLRNYIQYTLKRLYEENKILESADTDSPKVLFNTGLFSPLFEPILIMANKVEPTLYRNPQFVEGSRRSLMEIPFLKHSVSSDKKPAEEDFVSDLDDVPFASFYSDIGELVFDPTLPIDMSGKDFHKHIFEDKDRRKRFNLPDPSISDTSLFDKLSKATERAQKIAKRNYKLVVPQWSFEFSRVQFLMPMYWEEFKGEPFCALVLDLVEDQGGKYYEAKTILTLDACYQNARLIAKPDNTWLIP